MLETRVEPHGGNLPGGSDEGFETGKGFYAAFTAADGRVPLGVHMTTLFLPAAFAL
jgi:hypothetical protein